MLAVIVGVIITRMGPQFRLMQDRIDAVNRVLREQITGIRVVRAFVREPAASASGSATPTTSCSTSRSGSAGCRR